MCGGDSKLPCGKGITMTIRQAEMADIPRLLELLLQVHAVHSEGRPDIFRRGGRKYEKEDLAVILASPETPVFVAEEEESGVLGYARSLPTRKQLQRLR